MISGRMRGEVLLSDRLEHLSGRKVRERESAVEEETEFRRD